MKSLKIILNKILFVNILYELLSKYVKTTIIGNLKKINLQSKCIFLFIFIQTKKHPTLALAGSRRVIFRIILIAWRGMNLPK